MPHSQLQLSTSGELRMLVGQIRGYLSSTDQTGDDAIHELWRRYVDSCQQLNQRLDLCSQFLERGEWMEALRSAELEPNLFDCITSLDFPKRQEWERLGVDLGWERLIPVSVAIGERLQTAWDHRKRLRPLLREHMRLSVSRASLARRLAVMHELAIRDRMSTFWRDDIQRLERSRGPQLLRELQQAIKASDAPQLVALLKEVHETPWTLKLPASVRRFSEKAESIVLEAVHLPETVRALNEAMQTSEVSQASPLLEQWHTQLERFSRLGENPSPATEALIQSAARVVEWADRIAAGQSLQSQWQDSAQRVIEAARTDNTSLRDLRRLRDELNVLGQQIPAGQRDASLAEAAETAFRNVRNLRVLSWCVNGAMVAAAILIPGFFITVFMMWVFS